MKGAHPIYESQPARPIWRNVVGRMPIAVVWAAVLLTYWGGAYLAMIRYRLSPRLILVWFLLPLPALAVLNWFNRGVRIRLEPDAVVFAGRLRRRVYPLAEIERIEYVTDAEFSRHPLTIGEFNRDCGMRLVPRRGRPVYFAPADPAAFLHALNAIP